MSKEIKNKEKCEEYGKYYTLDINKQGYVLQTDESLSDTEIRHLMEYLKNKTQEFKE